MKALLTILILLAAAIPGARAITTYDLTLHEGDVLINATFELYASAPGEKVNYWTTSFSLPGKGTLLSISDSKGTLANYSIRGEKLFLETNKGGLKDKEVVSFLFRLEKAVSNDYAPLRSVNLSLAAFGDVRPDVPDEQTFVSMKVPDLISFTESLGFAAQIVPGGVRFAGEGPVAFTAFFGRGRVYDHYVLFGDGDLTAADRAFGIIPAVLGFVPEFKRFPVVILVDEEYERRINAWSSGQFRGGVILLKGANVSLGTILHETTHGFNERALRWQRAKGTWFDEGVANYVEFLVRRRAGERLAELFGEPVTWRDGFSVYTVPPRSTAEELQSYVQQGRTFMQGWTPDHPATREFGYAFSELVIRDTIQKRGPEALHTVFSTLLSATTEISSEAEHAALLLGLLGSDFRPCFDPNLGRMKACLKDINSMNPDIPANVTIGGTLVNITIPQISQPREEPLATSIISQILHFLSSLLAALRGALGV